MSAPERAYAEAFRSFSSLEFESRGRPFRRERRPVNRVSERLFEPSCITVV